MMVEAPFRLVQTKRPDEKWLKLCMYFVLRKA